MPVRGTPCAGVEIGGRRGSHRHYTFRPVTREFQSEAHAIVRRRPRKVNRSLMKGRSERSGQVSRELSADLGAFPGSEGDGVRRAISDALTPEARRSMK